MTLEYNREYWTYIKIGLSYGVSEATCCRTIRWIEDVLIESGMFSLPGKNKLSDSELSPEIVVVDVTESPIERPKKNSENITQGKKASHT